MAHNFQTGHNEIKLLKEYESVTQTVLFGKVELAALMSGRKYDIIHQNGDYSRERNVRNSVFRNASPLSKRSVVTELNIESSAAR
jgi:hypothetical protein